MESIHVAESECTPEHFSIDRISGIEVETAWFERTHQPQLGEIVDQGVVDTPQLVLDCVVERSDDYPFVDEVLP